MDENTRQEFTNQEQEAPTSSSPKKKKGFYFKIIALALCCSVLGGIVGAGCVMSSGRLQTKIAVGQSILSALDDFDDFSISKSFRFGFPPFGRSSSDIEFAYENENYIGIAVTNSNADSDTPSGALIQAVEKGSPADKSGLRAGDIITMVNNVKIKSSDELSQAVAKANSGDVLKLTVYRQETTIDVEVTIGSQTI